MEMALKEKGLLHAQGTEEEKDQAAAIVVNAIGDTPLRVCQHNVKDALGMLRPLDERFSSTRLSSKVACLTAVFSKKYDGKPMENISMNPTNFLPGCR